VELILGNKNKSDRDKSGEYLGNLILESFVLPKTALLILQCEVPRCHARGTSFLFPKTEVLLDEFFEPNETILPLPSSEESSDDQLKSIHELFRSCQVLERLLVVHCVRHLQDSHSSPEILHAIQNPVYKRESIVTISLYYQLKSFCSCFSRLETKLNFRSSLHHYEPSQRSAGYKILNTTEHERQERSDWPYTGNTTEDSVYMGKLKHVPTCFKWA
jgi:hypothetical protein